MGNYERLIKIAFDKISGEILNADEIFYNKKDAFLIRRQFHEDKVELYCCECEQRLHVSTSKHDRLHFKHQPKADFCILKDGNLSPQEVDQHNKILVAKESERHKKLKNKIASLLQNVKGVDNASISIDNKVIIKNNERRRPDVYCKYLDKELVFEIQLSDLSLRYILSRYDFYRQNKMFLIWILDNFDVHKQAQLERDIKYLTKYENFFNLDENTKEFSLNCTYKFPFLTDDNSLLTKWLNKSIPFHELKFDSECYQIYYYNFGDNKTLKEKEQWQNAKQIKEVEKIKIEEDRLSAAKYKSKRIIQEIKILRERKSQYFGDVILFLSELNEFEKDVFNSMLNIKSNLKSKTPALNQWIKTATQEDIAFIDFVLNCNEIDIDVNERDFEGKTAFQEIYLNKSIGKYLPIKGLLKRGYQLITEDEALAVSIPDLSGENNNDLILYKLCMSLSDKSMIDIAYKYSKLLFIIEPAKHATIMGFSYKPNEWIAFANNAIQHYSKHWEYIEIAFKSSGLWKILIQLDGKGTFKKKITQFYLDMPEQEYDFEGVFRDLYPELAFSR